MIRYRALQVFTQSEDMMVLMIFVFSMWFYLSSLQERCWYRRAVVPLMLVAMVPFMTSQLAQIGLFVSGVLIYSGYKGRGRSEAQS